MDSACYSKEEYKQIVDYIDQTVETLPKFVANDHIPYLQSYRNLQDLHYYGRLLRLVDEVPYTVSDKSTKIYDRKDIEVINILKTVYLFGLVKDYNMWVQGPYKFNYSKLKQRLDDHVVIGDSFDNITIILISAFMIDASCVCICGSYDQKSAYDTYYSYLVKLLPRDISISDGYSDDGIRLECHMGNMSAKAIDWATYRKGCITDDNTYIYFERRNDWINNIQSQLYDVDRIWGVILFYSDIQQYKSSTSVESRASLDYLNNVSKKKNFSDVIYHYALCYLAMYDRMAIGS